MKTGRLTKGELSNISNRIDDIESIIKLCSDQHDGDILGNLEAELTMHIDTIKRSIRLSRIAESGLVLVKGGK